MLELVFNPVCEGAQPWNDTMKQSRENMSPPEDLATRVHRWVTVILVTLMAAELAYAVFEQMWMTVFLVGTIILIILAPTVLGPRFRVQIPAEYQILTIVFIFAALFLGEIRRYYERIWWWDIALHTSSGFLLGILGFLLVYVLNESDRVELKLKPLFLALFAFLFAVAIGTMWEIFEFAMDSLFGMQMQKPMLGDPSGLTDTMWDLIVDTLGAAAIALLGWWSLRRREPFFTQSWIDKFIDLNPHLFRR